MDRFPCYNGYAHGYHDDCTVYVLPDFPADLYSNGNAYPDIDIFAYLFPNRLCNPHSYRDCPSHLHAQSNPYGHFNFLPDSNRHTFFHNKSDQNTNIYIYVYSKPDSHSHPHNHQNRFTNIHANSDEYPRNFRLQFNS